MRVFFLKSRMFFLRRSRPTLRFDKKCEIGTSMNSVSRLDSHLRIASVLTRARLALATTVLTVAALASGGAHASLTLNLDASALQLNDGQNVSVGTGFQPREHPLTVRIKRLTASRQLSSMAPIILDRSAPQACQPQAPGTSSSPPWLRQIQSVRITT
jgi:hypothetical protein